MMIRPNQKRPKGEELLGTVGCRAQQHIAISGIPPFLRRLTSLRRRDESKSDKTSVLRRGCGTRRAGRAQRMLPESKRERGSCRHGEAPEIEAINLDEYEVKHSWCYMCGPAKTICSTLCYLNPEGRWVHVEGNPVAGNNWATAARACAPRAIPPCRRCTTRLAWSTP